MGRDLTVGNLFLLAFEDMLVNRTSVLIFLLYSMDSIELWESVYISYLLFSVF